MADPQPDNKNLLWAMIAGAVVLLLVIYIFAGADRTPKLVAPVAPASAPAVAPAPMATPPAEPAPAAEVPATPAPDAGAKPPS